MYGSLLCVCVSCTVLYITVPIVWDYMSSADGQSALAIEQMVAGFAEILRRQEEARQQSMEEKEEAQLRREEKKRKWPVSKRRKRGGS